MDFDLDRMGSLEFEHMIQALAIAELGNGVQIFGAGKDGGREATFNGAVDFPHGNGPTWNGYGVVQAKYRMFPAQEPALNASWVIAEIKSELDKFQPHGLEPAKRVPQPDYFLIATNVRLSPQQEVGGLDRVNAELEGWAKTLGLRGTYVWHHANICKLLEKHDGIRRSFAGLITTGDVLSRMLEYFPGPMASIATQIRIHAGQQLRAKQWVRLSESGLSDNDGHLPLSEVGVDLPGCIRLHGDDETEEAVDVNVIAHVIERGDANLRSEYRGGAPAALVLIGGPGQGKSTLGQLICQAYRVALIEETSGPSLGSNIDSLITAFRSNLETMKVGTPANRRWPVYVDLAKFGDAVAGDLEMTLLKFIASDIRPSGTSLKANELDRWKRDWPWLLVLDGLDEVAAFENRRDVIDRVSDFVVESNATNSDILIIATTRPQGYHGEFSEFDPEEIRLRDLAPSEALDYGIKITTKRHPEDPELLESVIKRLREAAEAPQTTRLMKSPLQVTIISTLLERLVRVPSTKHALFDAYYATIYSRETGKAGRFGQLLETHRDDVDYVHERVGLLLQARAERGGDAEALLSDDELENIFTSRLYDSGFTRIQATSLAEDLMHAARQRVVLLVGAEQDFVGFEVRALQEYMAARALSTGPDNEVLDRIEALASSAFWRNTLLLAVGRLFSQRDHIRDGLLGRIAQMDSNSRTGTFVGQGERLALDLLDDDIALAVPNFRRSLLAQALGTLKRWPTSDLERLARVTSDFINGADKQASELAKRTIEDALRSSGRSKISALVLLRHWQRQPGAAGEFANRLVAGLRTEINEPMGEPITASLSQILQPSLENYDLTLAQGKGNSLVLGPAADREFRRGLTLGEAASTASRPPEVQEAQALEGALKDQDFLDSLMSAIDSLTVEDAAAGMWLAKIVGATIERRPVANDGGLAGLQKKESA